MRRSALAALGAAVLLSGLDQTVVVAVLPRIVSDLHLSVAHLDEAAWLVTAYLLGYTAALPVVGRLADVHGLRAAFAGCAALFAAGSLWAALAGGLWPLVGARALQAVGGGGLVPVALAATEGRVVALGAIAGAAEAGAVLGPLWGAELVRAFGWRSIFWINLPVTAVLLVAAFAALPRARRTDERLDLAGSALATAALLALALGLSGGGVGLGWPARGPLFAAAAALGLGYVAQQRGSRFPLLPLALFRRAPFAAANAANVLIGAALIVALVEVPLYADVVLHESASDGGLLLLRLTAFIPLGAVAGGRLAARLSYAAVAAAGMLVAAAGFALLAHGVSWTSLAPTGLGFGLVLAPLAGAALGAARGGREAVAAASLTVSRMLGMMIGLTSLTTWGIATFDRRAGRYPLPVGGSAAAQARYERLVADAALYVFDRLFLVAAALCLAAAVAAAWLERDVPGLPARPRRRDS